MRTWWFSGAKPNQRLDLIWRSVAALLMLALGVVSFSARAAATVTTTTTLTASPNPAYVSQSVTLTATVTGSSPTGKVTFKNGSTTLGTGTLSAGKATLTTSFTTTGSRSLTAVYAGDTVNKTSTSSAVTETIKAKVSTSTALSSSINPATVNQSVTLTATVSGTSPTGTVTFKDGRTTLGTGTLSAGKATLATSFSTTGGHSLTAVYSGDTVNKTSTSSAVTETVNAQKTSTTTLTSSANPVYANQSVTLTATVTGTSPTGTVTFKDGTTTLGSGTLSAGKATLATSFTTAGSHSLTAIYAGDTVNKPSTSSALSETVNAQTTSTTTLTSSANPTDANQSVTLTATVTGASPTGIVTFKDGSTTLGTGTLSAGLAMLTTSFTVAGNHSLTAVYAGDGLNTSSASSVLIETVYVRTTSTTVLTSSINPVYLNQSVTLTAAVTGADPTGTVTFQDGTTNLGSVALSGGQATLTTTFSTIGSHGLSVSYGGDMANTASISSTVIVQVAGTDTGGSSGAMTWLYGYDPLGNPTMVVDSNGNQTTTAYDGLSRPSSMTLPPAYLGAPQPQVTLKSDGLDNLVQVSDPRNLITSYTIDGLGNKSATSSPDAGLVTTIYDAAGNLVSSKDARGKTTTYSYDSLNRPILISYASGVSTILEYDGGASPTPTALGRLTKMSDESGSTTYTYDVFGRVLTKTQKVVSSVGTRSLQLIYTWGNSGNAAGKLTSITYPSSMRVNYDYDSAGRLSFVSVDGANSNGVGTSSGATIPVLSGVTFNGTNDVLGWVWGNGSNYQRSYDSFGRLSSYPLGDPTGTGAAAGLIRTLAYDGAGRITAYSHASGAGALPQFDQSFSYDGRDRLSSMALNSASYSYTYDLNGNRTARMLGGMAFGNTVDPYSNRLTQVQVPSGSSAVTVTHTYDAAGNLTNNGSTIATYNDRGRQSKASVAGGDVSYLYNGLGQRVVKTGPTTLVSLGAVYFAYDETGQLLGEYDANLVPISETVYLGQLPVAIVKQDRSTSVVNTNVANVYADQLGTPRVITRNTDNAMLWRWDQAEAFGDTPPDQNPSGLGMFVCNQRFPGQYFDKETGNFYNYFRTYNPSTGRYLQSDPIGLDGGLNTYAYVGGNPTGLVDPEGLNPAALGAMGSGAGTGGLLGGLGGASRSGGYGTQGGYDLRTDTYIPGPGCLTCMEARRSEKERATDTPSWSKSHFQRPDENCAEFAKRVLEEHYGCGHPKAGERGPGSEYSKIKKHCERGGR